MVRFYVYVTGDKITYSETTELEILSPGYNCLYYGEEANMPDFMPRGLKTEKGGYFYSLIDGKVVERTAEEIAADEEAANPEPIAPATDAPTWDELAAALQEGVDAV